MPQGIEQLLQQAAQQFNLPYSLLLAVSRQESGVRMYRPDGRIITSSAGALGAMQVMPFHDKWARGKGWDIKTPQGNVMAGAALLRGYVDQNQGNISSGLRQYFGGRGGRDTPKAFAYANKIMGSNQSPSTGAKGFHPVQGPYQVTSHFGAKHHGYYKEHSGVDFSAALGTTVISVVNGEVVSVKSSAKGYGKSILIKGEDGRAYRYAHLSAQDVKQGQTVQAGQTIGKVGSTGNSTGPHLHFEVIGPDGRFINPEKFLQGAEKLPYTPDEPMPVMTLEDASNTLAKTMADAVPGVPAEVFTSAVSALTQEIQAKIGIRSTQAGQLSQPLGELDKMVKENFPNLQVDDPWQ